MVPVQPPAAGAGATPLPLPQRSRDPQPDRSLRRALAIGLALAAVGPAGSASADLRLDRVGNFDQPVYVHGPEGAGDVVFVVEQEGRVRVMRGGRKLPGSFLDIAGKVTCCGESGLLSIAFPDFDRDRRFYVYLTDPQGDIKVVEFKRRRDRLKANEGSARTVLEISHKRFSNHNGGQLQFGSDGLLYVGTGDGGGANDPSGNAQDKGSLLGKLLRINPLRKGRREPYGIPGSNPYAGEKGRDEIFSRGLRNPWRFSFDKRRILIGDVGQDAVEEIDAEKLGKARGANFGWDAFEGDRLIDPPSPSGHEGPIHTLSHSAGNCSITGGYVVRDPRLGKGLRGRYVYGDFCAGEIRSLVPDLGGARDDGSLGLPNVPSLSSFGVDDRRRVYVASLEGGVFRLER